MSQFVNNDDFTQLINSSTVKFLEGQELIQDLKTIMSDLSTKMIDTISTSKVCKTKNSLLNTSGKA